jgi:hypothetical protein
MRRTRSNPRAVRWEAGVGPTVLVAVQHPELRRGEARNTGWRVEVQAQQVCQVVPELAQVEHPVSRVPAQVAHPAEQERAPEQEPPEQERVQEAGAAVRAGGPA